MKFNPNEPAKAGTIKMNVTVDEKAMWHNVMTTARRNQNTAEFASMALFLVMFATIAVSILFDLLKWELASTIASAALVATIVSIGVCYFVSFRQMNIKHKAMEKIDELEQKEMREKLEKEAVVVDNDGKPVKLTVQEIVEYSTRYALEHYKKELAEMHKKLAAKDGQRKANKRK